MEDDGLGYYDDGVKRTLTDEQIAIFRHSELEASAREKRHQEEARRAGLDEGKGQGPSATHAPATKKRKSKQQYFQRRVSRKDLYQTEDGQTHRRVAREQDEIQNFSVELDY